MNLIVIENTYSDKTSPECLSINLIKPLRQETSRHCPSLVKQTWLAGSKKKWAKKKTIKKIIIINKIKLKKMS